MSAKECTKCGAVVPKYLDQLSHETGMSLECLRVQNARLYAIVGKLPTDANGNPVVPCVDPLWVIGNDGIGCMGDEFLDDGKIYKYDNFVWHRDHWCLWEAGEADGLYWDGPVHATFQAAAEAARTERGES